VTQMDLFQTATFSQQDTHASHLVRPGSDEARKMTVTSGRKYLPLCKRSGRLGAFSRMFLDTSAWDSTKCYLTWKAKVTPSNRLLFQLAPSVPRTDAIGSGSLLHTPTATANQMAPSMRNRDAGSWGPGMWATPRTTDATGGPRKLDEKGRRISQTNPNSTFGANLADQAKMWPTPRASGWKGTGPLGSKSHNHRLEKGYLDATVQERGQVSGSLNPAWVEWLMGYPEGWTDLKG